MPNSSAHPFQASWVFRGLVALAYLPAALVASFLSPTLGRLSDRVGRAPLMALGLAGSGLLALLIPALPNLLWLAALWALEAVGLAMAVPAETAFVADLTGGEQRGAGYGLYTFATSLGAVCGPVLQREAKRLSQNHQAL